MLTFHLVQRSPNSHMRNTEGKVLMKVVRSDHFLIIYVENRELSVRRIHEYREYKICCMKVVRLDRFLITCIENRELNAVGLCKSTAIQKWSNRTVLLSLTSMFEIFK